MGVQLFMNNQVHRLEELEDGKGIRAHLKSGKSLLCQAVVYAIGTRPNMDLAKSAGLSCGIGVQVNAYLQTSDPSVYAVGEIAEFDGRLNGITAAAEMQADIAARHLNGDLLSIYQGTISMNILKLADLDLCSLGMPEIPAQGEGYEEILLIDSMQRYYKKCLVHKDRLVGAILMGDKSEFAEFKALIEEKIELSQKRKELLRGKGGKGEMIGEMVCSCGNVGKGNLVQAIDAGSRDLGKLCKQTGAGLGCGSCKPEIQYLLDQHQVAMVDA